MTASEAGQGVPSWARIQDAHDTVLKGGWDRPMKGPGRLLGLMRQGAAWQSGEGGKAYLGHTKLWVGEERFSPILSRLVVVEWPEEDLEDRRSYVWRTNGTGGLVVAGQRLTSLKPEDITPPPEYTTPRAMGYAIQPPNVTHASIPGDAARIAMYAELMHGIEVSGPGPGEGQI